MRIASCVFAVLVLALALAPVPAAAEPGLALAWRACPGLPTATSVQTFACDRNLNPDESSVYFHLIGAFTPGQSKPDFAGLTARVSFATQEPMLPAWWGHGGGGCREGSITVLNSYGALGLCTNPFAVGSPIAVGYVWEYMTTSYARLSLSVEADVPHAIVADTRYTAFHLRIDAQRTVDDGTPACPGCCTPVCILFGDAQLYSVDGSVETLNANSPDALVGWNGQASPSTPFGCSIVGGCPTPAARSTWGAIKSVYR